MQVKVVNKEQILSLRHRVLRPGLDISTAHYDCDQLLTTKHYAVLENAEAIAALTLCETEVLPLSLEFLSLPLSAYLQLRGMAVAKEMQGTGIGKFLVEKVIEDLQQINSHKILWCNARTYALPFYEKLGFKVVGQEFEIKDVGPHYVMYLSLSGE